MSENLIYTDEDYNLEYFADDNGNVFIWLLDNTFVPYQNGSTLNKVYTEYFLTQGARIFERVAEELYDALVNMLLHEIERDGVKDAIKFSSWLIEAIDQVESLNDIGRTNLVLADRISV